MTQEEQKLYFQSTAEKNGKLRKNKNKYIKQYI